MASKSVFALFALVGLTIMVSGCTQTSNPVENHPDDYHAHADFKVYLNGVQFDFNKTEYMSTPYKSLSEKTHLHDFNPTVMHFHDKSVTIGDFFTTLGMSLDTNCFSDGKTKYCSDTENNLRMYVNETQNTQFGNYIPTDLDKILIFYGQAEPSKEMFDSLTNQACIYSEKCQAPEGFVLPPESCVASKPCKLDD